MTSILKRGGGGGATGTGIENSSSGVRTKMNSIGLNARRGNSRLLRGGLGLSKVNKSGDVDSSKHSNDEFYKGALKTSQVEAISREEDETISIFREYAVLDHSVDGRKFDWQLKNLTDTNASTNTTSTSSSNTSSSISSHHANPTTSYYTSRVKGSKAVVSISGEPLALKATKIIPNTSVDDILNLLLDDERLVEYDTTVDMKNEVVVEGFSELGGTWSKLVLDVSERTTIRCIANKCDTILSGRRDFLVLTTHRVLPDGSAIIASKSIEDTSMASMGISCPELASCIRGRVIISGYLIQPSEVINDPSICPKGHVKVTLLEHLDPRQIDLKKRKAESSNIMHLLVDHRIAAGTLDKIDRTLQRDHMSRGRAFRKFLACVPNEDDGFIDILLDVGASLSDCIKGNFWEYYDSKCDSHGCINSDTFSSLLTEMFVTILKGNYTFGPDESANHKVTVDELVSLATRALSLDNVQIVMKNLFKALDYDGDGVISKADLINFFYFFWGLERRTTNNDDFIDELDARHAWDRFISLYCEDKANRSIEVMEFVSLFGLFINTTIDTSSFLYGEFLLNLARSHLKEKLSEDIDEALENELGTKSIPVEMAIHRLFDKLMNINQDSGNKLYPYELFIMMGVDAYVSFMDTPHEFAAHLPTSSHQSLMPLVLTLHRYLRSIAIKFAEMAVLKDDNIGNQRVVANADVVTLLMDVIGVNAGEQIDTLELDLQSKPFPNEAEEFKEVISDIIGVGLGTCRTFIIGGDGGVRALVASIVDILDFNNDGFVSYDDFNSFDSAIRNVSRDAKLLLFKNDPSHPTFEAATAAYQASMRALVAVVIKVIDANSEGVIDSSDILKLVDKAAAIGKALGSLSVSFAKVGISALLVPIVQALLAVKAKFIGGDRYTLSENDISIFISLLMGNHLTAIIEAYPLWFFGNTAGKTGGKMNGEGAKGVHNSADATTTTTTTTKFLVDGYDLALLRAVLDGNDVCPHIARLKSEYHSSSSLSSSSSSSSYASLLSQDKLFDFNQIGSKYLWIAAIKGSVDVVNALINEGIDVNIQDALGLNALIYACYNGHGPIVDLISKANIKQFDLDAIRGENDISSSSNSYSNSSNEIEPDCSGGGGVHVKLSMEEMEERAGQANNIMAQSAKALLAASSNGHVAAVHILIANCGFRINEVGLALFQSAKHGHNSVVESLLSYKGFGKDVGNIQYNNGRTALMVASDRGNLLVIEALLAAGVDVDMQDDDGKTALFYACEKGQMKAADLLLKANASIDMSDNDGVTCLMNTAKMAQLPLVEYLIARKAKIDAYDKGGRNALMWAFDVCHVFIVDCLLLNGADINSRIGGDSFDDVSCDNYNDYTLLMWAALEDRQDVVDMLIIRGANIDLRNQRGNTALMLATMNNNATIITSLLDAKSNVNLLNDDNETALMIAAKESFVDIVKMLLLHGANVDLRNQSGNTALMLAVMNNSDIIVESLLDAKSNVNHVNSNSETALMIVAAKQGYDKVLKLLILHEANTELCDLSLNTATIIAAMNNNVTVIESLIEAKANVNHLNKYNETALMIAAREGFDDIVKMLIKHGADIDLQSIGNKCSALMSATIEGRLSTIKLLLNANANVHLEDCDGMPALFWALEHYHAEDHRSLIGSLLLDYWLKARPKVRMDIDSGYDIMNPTPNIGADYQASNGDTVLMWACQHSRLDIANRLLSASTGGPIFDSAYDSCDQYYTPTVEMQNGKNGKTALMYAVLHGDLQIVRELVKFDKNIYLKDNDGKDVFGYVDSSTSSSKIKLENKILVKAELVSVWNSALFDAVSKGDLFGFKRLFDMRRDDDNIELLRCRDPAQNTPLLVASKLGCSAIVEAILNMLGNVSSNDIINLVNKEGNSSLIEATIAGNKTVVLLLLSSGAKILSIKNKSYETAVLIGKKAAAACTSTPSATAIPTATAIDIVDMLEFYDHLKSGNLEVIKRVLSVEERGRGGGSGAGGGGGNDSGCPLHLLAIGFDEHGDSPILIAIQNGHLEVVKYFLETFDDLKLLSIKNRLNKKNVFDYACVNNSTGIFSRSNPYRVLEYLTTYVNKHNDEVDDTINTLITDMDVKAVSLNDLIKKIIPWLNLSYERDFGGGRHEIPTISTVLQYFREIKLFDSKRVMRTKLLLVGAGFSGKTTLVHRLRTREFKSKRDATDGIDMCDVTLRSDNEDEVIFTIFDFAGQKEYTHTHQLFFDKEAMFLVVYRPDSDMKTQLELEDFVLKINNCIDAEEEEEEEVGYSSAGGGGTTKIAKGANIVFAASNCDRFKTYGKFLGLFLKNPTKEDIKKHVDEKRESLFGNTSMQGRVHGSTLEFDSESGSGYTLLQNTLVNLAWFDPKKAVTYPNRWNDFRGIIRNLSEKKGVFALSEDELLQEVKDKLGSAIKIDTFSLAIRMFLSWGLLYKLVNGDLVLQPQRLANVLACVFSNDTSNLDKTLKTIGHIKHDNDVMQKIWGRKASTEESNSPPQKQHCNVKDSAHQQDGSSGSKKYFNPRYWLFETKSEDGVITRKTPPFLELLYEAGLAYPLIDPQSLKPVSRSLVPALLRKLPGNKIDKDKLPWDELGDVKEACSKKQQLLPDDCVTDSVIELKCESKWGLSDSLISRLHVALHGYCNPGLAWRQGFVVDMKYKLANKDYRSIAIVFVSYTNRKIYIISASNNGLATAAKCKVILTLKDILKKEFRSLVLVGFPTVHIQALIENQVVDNIKKILSDSKAILPDSITNLYDCIKRLISLRGKLATQPNTGEGGGGGNNDVETNDTILELQNLLFGAIPDILELQGISRELDRKHKLQRSCLWILLQHKITKEISAFPITPQVDILSDGWNAVLEDSKVSLSPSLSLSAASSISVSDVSDKAAAVASNDVLISELDDDEDLKDTARRRVLYIILEMLFEELFIELPSDFGFSPVYFLKDQSDCKKILEADRNEKKFKYMDQFKRKVTKETFEEYQQRMDKLARDLHEKEKDERDKEILRLEAERLRIEKERIEKEMKEREEDKERERLRDEREKEKTEKEEKEREEDRERERQRDERDKERLRLAAETAERDKERLRLERSRLELENKRRDMDQTTQNMVLALLRGTHDVPTLFVIIPVKKTFFGDFFNREYRLYFICSHTKRISICGPAEKRGKGFKIKLQREWVKKALPYLKVSLMLANIALSTLGGIRLPDISSLLPDTHLMEKTLDHFVDDYVPAQNMIDLDKEIRKALSSLEDSMKRKVTEKVHSYKDSLESDRTSTPEKRALVSTNLIPPQLSLLGFGDDVDPVKYDQIKKFLCDEVTKKYHANWRELIGLKMVTRTSLDNSTAVDNSGSSAATIVGGGSDSISATGGGDASGEGEESEGGGGGRVGGRVGGRGVGGESNLAGSRLGITTWVFDDPAVEDSFKLSDTPTEAALRAVDDAYNTIIK